jgi:hypothetical protein
MFYIINLSLLCFLADGWLLLPYGVINEALKREMNQSISTSAHYSGRHGVLRFTEQVLFRKGMISHEVLTKRIDINYMITELQVSGGK